MITTTFIVHAIFLMSKEIYQRPGKLLKILIYFWLCWIFVDAHGLSLRVMSGHLTEVASRCRARALECRLCSCGVWCMGSLDQRSNPCPLHWQADSKPLDQKESPQVNSLKNFFFKVSLLKSS